MIAILYPLKMDKNLSEAYSSIYESSLTSGSGGGSGRNAMSDGGDGVHRSFSQTANMFNKNIPAAKNGKVDKSTRKAVNTSAKDFGIQGPTTVKASHEPEGEMIDEKLSKEQQKKYDDHVKKMQDADKKKKKTGNPAFDDPSHHSFAKNKIKKNIFDEKEYNYVNSYLDELKKTTMGSYIAKASKDLADRRFDQGDSEKRKYDPDEADEKEDKKLDKREQGIARAAKKITKEDYVDEKVMGADTTMRMMAAKDRAKGKDKLLSKKEGETHAANMKRKIQMSPSYAGEEVIVQRLIDSGKFTKEEIESIINS